MGRPHWLATGLLVGAALMLPPEARACAAGQASLAQEHQSLLSQMRAVVADEPYVVIDTHDNQLIVRTRAAVLHAGPCATGSGRKLSGRKAWHKWQFHTPRGRFAIIRKVEDPLWVRPTWDFVEAGEQIPIFPEDARRFERGVLGEYALYFLKDFMIHGTLYEVNLGRSITHGCVRVDASHLRYLYETVQVGCPVYVY